jgi:phosphoribosylformimino-5-aminoimidazole carboxamide ribotide isomerase
MEIIIAIDLIGGKCVRLEQGDYSKKTSYYDDPLEVALLLEANGIKRLHLVDLDGAKAGTIHNLKTLERIASKTKLLIDFGGGIKSEKDFESVLNAGAVMGAIGSMAVKNKNEVVRWGDKYGKEKLFIGADVKNGKIAVSGWLKESNETIEPLIKYYLQHEIDHFFCTDISKDGMLSGPAIDLYKQLMNAFPTLQLTASGGVSQIEDIYALEDAGCDGVIIGKAFYENRITLEQLKDVV